MKKLLILVFLFLIPISVYAENERITINGNIANKKINDNNENTYIKVEQKDIINIKNNSTIYGLYIVYELKSETGTININNNEIAIGENGFLHEYIDIYSKIKDTQELNISYNNDVKIGEIYIIDTKELPEFVEVWDKPLDNNTDLLLLSTHSDDEHLFFLGLLPTYISRGANVQVVYLTNHFDNPKRLHEQLHGLYAVGVKNYPVIGFVPDAYSTTLEGAITNIEKANITLDDVLYFQTEIIRRFKPSVIVGHDELGEYSHGQHILNTHTLKLALEKTNDETYHIESAKKYGIWDTPKTYIHLYKENKIIMDYDTPLDYFNGLTAYEVSKLGYSKHNSQQWTWFTKWIKGSNNSYTKSTDIKTYSPNEYGLYKTLVGQDIEKNDMFENITYRKDIKKEETNVENEHVLNDNNNTIHNNQSSLYIILIPLLLLTIIFIIYKIKSNKKQ